MATKTANEDFFDSVVRHQVVVRRISAGEAKKILKLLNKSTRQLAAQLKERLEEMGGRPDFTTRRFQKMLNDIKSAREEVIASVGDDVAGSLEKLARREADVELATMKRVIPVKVDLAGVSLEQVKAVVQDELVHGKTLNQWFSGLTRLDADRIDQAVQLGVTQGETIPQIVARFEAAGEATSFNAESVVRTAVNHVSNSAREEVWDANSDIIDFLRWTSTLDGRTSAICRARDGKLVKVNENAEMKEGMELLEPEGARPPAHPGCRSVMVASLDGGSILGNRPFVTDTRTRAEREVDFREQAKLEGKSVKQVRAEWAAENIGTVPSETTYDEFLRRQPAEFQDDVLGAEKGKLYRENPELTMDQFVDHSGKELTVDELEEEIS